MSDIGSAPSSLLSGLAIDAVAERKTFPIEDILSVATGLMLAPEGPGGIHRLVAFMMGAATGENAADPSFTALHIRQVRECLLEQFPVLRDLDMGLLLKGWRKNPSRLDEEMQMWLEIQRGRFGESREIFSVSRWQRRKNSHKL